MGQAVAAPYVAFEDYFEAEATSQADAPRHEWFDGVVYAMSRGTPEHGRIVSRIARILGNGLPPDCEVYSSDTMLYIPAAALSTYADASVVCGSLETVTVKKNGKSLGQAVTNPIVLVEVLSESTERYDRDGKFQAYKQIATLKEYVLVSQERRCIEVFRRAAEWAGELAKESERITIHGVEVQVDRIYGTGA